MAIKFITGVSKAELVKRLAASVRTQKDIFNPIHILTPGPAQDNWLKEQLAERNSIAAHIHFSKLDGFIRLLEYRLCGRKAGERLSAENFIWILFDLLGSEDFRNNFPEIADYSGEDEVKRLALAQRVAKLFDQYQDHRPEMILQWKEDEAGEISDWQKYLFTKAYFEEPDKTAVLKEFKAALQLEENQNALQKDFSTLYIFGYSRLSPFYLDVLKLLGEYISVEFYSFSNVPASLKNPLLESWGEAICDFNLLLREKQFSLPESSSESILPKNLLQQIQTDINENRGPVTGSYNDDSIQIHNCYTPHREVEALYNYIAHLINKDSTLKARDIIVYAPNLKDYISPVRTVFDSAPYWIPYTFATNDYVHEENFWTALAQLMAIRPDDCTAPVIFQLMEIAPIRENFGFEDLDLLKKAIKDANIRRDLHGQMEDESCFSSWSFGIKRLIYAYCTGSEDAFLGEDGNQYLPVDLAEGKQANDLFRLHNFICLLEEFLENKKGKKSLEEWTQLTIWLAENFLNANEENVRDFHKLISQIGISSKLIQQSVEFNTYYFRLKDQLEGMDLKRIDGKGGITFTSLLPGGSIPKKVVAFLGMDFGAFPRKKSPLHFNKLTADPKVGDPDIRKQDKASFLDAFLNAGEHLFLSYKGQSIKNNKELPPASIIDEIKDYAAHYGQRDLEVKHALHAHNSVYYSETSPLYTYLLGADEVKEVPEKEKQQEKKEAVSVNLYEIARFLKDPFKNYYNRVLGIYYEDPELLPETELFELDNLQRWAIKNELLNLENVEEEINAPDVRKILVQKGMLPLRNVGELCLGNAVEKVNLLRERIRELCEGRSIILAPVHVKLQHFPRLEGKIYRIENGPWLFVTVSKDKIKYKLQACLHYLLLVAAEEVGTFFYLALDDKEEKALCIQLSDAEITPDRAKEILKYWLELYEKNTEKIVPFYPDFNFDLKEIEALTEETPEAIAEAIEGKMEDPVGSQYYSEYLFREYENAFFSKEGNSEYFTAVTKEILQVIDDVFEPKKMQA